MVDASFMQTLWNMNPVSSGCELVEGKLKDIQTCLVMPVALRAFMSTFVPSVFRIFDWRVRSSTLSRPHG